MEQDEQETDLVLDYLIEEFQFDDSFTGFILFQIIPSSMLPLNDGTGNGSGIYRFSLPIPSYSGVLSLITDSHLLSTLEDPPKLLPLQLSILILDPTMKIVGKCLLHFDEELFFVNDQNNDKYSHSQSLIWTYEYESMINHAVGVGTLNGSIKGTIQLHKLPRFKDPILPRPKPKDEFEEFGEGSLNVTEFFPSEEASDSSSDEPLFKLTLPRSSAEPLERREKPLRHFMSVGDQREIQTEYRPGYRRLIGHSESPPRLTANRPPWAMSQSVRSLNPPAPRDHLLRCVACWLKSTQCQTCVEGQSFIDQLAPDDRDHPPVARDAPPPPPQRRHRSPPAAQSQEPFSQKPLVDRTASLPSSKPPTKPPKQHQKARSRSQPRSRPTPTADHRTAAPASSSSRRIRQHTFSSAIAAKPSPSNSSKTSRGFHFVNPQPADLPHRHPSRHGRSVREHQRTPPASGSREGQPRSSNSFRQHESLVSSSHQSPRQSQALLSPESRQSYQDDPLADCGYYPKVSSPVRISEDCQDEIEGVIHIAADTRIPPSGSSGEGHLPIFSGYPWELEDQILYIDG
jgi:hypothetical protein